MDKNEKEAKAWKAGIEELDLLEYDDEIEILDNYMQEEKWKEASEFCRGKIVTASYSGKNLTEEDMVAVVREKYEELS